MVVAVFHQEGVDDGVAEDAVDWVVLRRQWLVLARGTWDDYAESKGD